MLKLTCLALPQEDESLFLWLSRFAALQGMLAKQFLAYFDLTLSTDPDRTYEGHFFSTLAELSGECPQKIKIWDSLAMMVFSSSRTEKTLLCLG